MGGFDQMVATLGGGWDALLGQGLHWTITATSDSHGHWTAGGADFWPGEYAKTWVLATPTGADILDGLRSGRVFVHWVSPVLGILVLGYALWNANDNAKLLGMVWLLIGVAIAMHFHFSKKGAVRAQ